MVWEKKERARGLEGLNGVRGEPHGNKSERARRIGYYSSLRFHKYKSGANEITVRELIHI